MNTLDLKDAIETYSLEYGLERDSILDSVADVFASEFSEHLNVMDDDVEVDIGDDYRVSLFLKKDVVEKKEDERMELTLEEALAIDKNAILGQTVKAPIDFDELNRGEIRKLNASLMYRLRNIHKEVLHREYKAKEGEIITGTFIRRYGRDIFLDIGKTDAKLSYLEQAPHEQYKQGDQIRTYLKDVLLDERNRLMISLSRTDVNFVKKLFEVEVPEIAEGIIKIKTIVREPGYKVKMAVYSTKSEVEPVGACVGLAGIRIKGVIKELSGEKIDVIPYSTHIKEFLARAMQPAQVSKVLIINDETKEAIVVVEDDIYPLAIGKGGVNIKLASRLTGWKINLKTISQIKKQPEILKIFSKAEDLFFKEMETDLHQLTEIKEELIVKLMNVGIMHISDLYEKTIDEISKIEGISSENAKHIRKTLDELVEVVEDEETAQAAQRQYLSEFEDEIKGVNTDEVIQEEIQQVEYLVCPNCKFEFEFKEQERCPSCNVEFEFTEEES